MDYYNASFSQTLSQIMQRLQNYELRMQNFEKKMKELEFEIIQLKEKPNMQVDRIEYKFDQLKVEKLNGTLNIGLNPFSGEAIEDFSVTGDQIKMNGQPFHSFQPAQPEEEQKRLLALQKEAENYLCAEGKKVIQQIAGRLDTRVSEEVMNYIIDDIRRQLPARIHFQQGVILQNQKKAFTPDELNEAILQALKQDIEQAVQTFLIHLPKEMGEEKTK